MLSRADLERLAEIVSRGNVGHAEKLYLQDIILSTISRETVDELVFNGGTALLKCYQLDRFSEDLEFTARGEVDMAVLVDAAVRDLTNYGTTVADRSIEETETTVRSRLGIQGPRYTGDRRSVSFVRLEGNKRSTVSNVQTRRYTPPFPDLPTFDLAVLGEDELLAEKVRALVTREEPRDLYDCYHLLSNGVTVDAALVREKLDYYGLDYDPDTILDAASALESTWTDLDALTYSSLPSFSTAYTILRDELLSQS